MGIFFVSDTHFGHNKNFLYEPRGFQTITEMNEAIVENWNKVVHEDDIVYHLGDVMLGNNEEGLKYFNKLNGEIIIIYGNHDTDARKNLFPYYCPQFRGGKFAWVIKYHKYSIYLSHYPTLTSNFDDKHFSQHVINLHGHTHQTKNFLFPENPFMYHVGVDSHNCTPVHIDEIISDIRQRWNEINQLPEPIKPQNLYPYINYNRDND